MSFYGSRGNNLAVSRIDTGLSGRRYGSTSGSSMYSRGSFNTLPDKFPYSGRSGSTYTSKAHDYSAYGTNGTSYTGTQSYSYLSAGRTGRSEVKEVVRPSIRSRGTSVNRDIGSTQRERSHRDSSLPRRGSTRDYPDYRTRASSPARTTHVSVPEFKTIHSSYASKSRTTRNGQKVLTNGSSSYLNNGHVSCSIEIERKINKPSRITADNPDPKSYSPSFAQNRTSNNNKDYENDTSSSTRSSAGSKRDEVYQNGERTSPASSSRDFQDPRAGLVGIKNIGNTCFMNSILQCLSNTRPLRDYCLNKRRYERDINKSSSPMKGKLVEAFSEIIRQLWSPQSSGSAVSTSSFKRQIETFSKRFSGYEQQDSQEFLRFLIEGLHEDVNKVEKKHKDSIPNFDSLCDDSKARKTWDFYLSKDNSYIVDLFMGQLKSSLTCAECQHVSTTFDPFWDLSLPIPKHSSIHDKLDVQSCLDNFTKEEVLEGDERPTCEKCRARRRMTKKFTIYKFPKILVIHLKRFNDHGRYRQKLQSRVDFPHKLDISKPVSTGHESFNLYAVSNHSGSCYGGHYTAHCKNPETGKWHSFSDTLVSAMSQSSVQTKEAYVLFYESTPGNRSHL